MVSSVPLTIDKPRKHCAVDQTLSTHTSQLLAYIHTAED